VAASPAEAENWPAWKQRIHEVIFEADTPAGKFFDVVLLIAIILSVGVVMLDSLPGLSEQQTKTLLITEWILTGLFSAEYILRLLCVRKPMKYATSFFGLVDLFAILPTYISLLLPGSQSLLVIRVLRLVRIFRVFKLTQFIRETAVLKQAFLFARYKILIFLLTVLCLTLILGSAMYVVEGPEHGFTSIPRGTYWAIVTMTTVGYGDITPQTSLGQTLSAIAMLLGYSLIVVPTGLISAGLTRQFSKQVTTIACPDCMREGHDEDAKHCKFCGGVL
jgi:voltage-gated potassium channel